MRAAMILNGFCHLNVFTTPQLEKVNFSISNYLDCQLSKKNYASSVKL